MIKQPKKITNEIKWNFIGILGKLFIDFLFSTTKIETKGFEKVAPIISSRKFIFAIWHSRILLFSYLYKNRLQAAILVSQSEDGEIIARILQKQGNKLYRGSTSKGGVRALSRLIKIIEKEERPGVIIPDGPRGPAFKAQAGVIAMAKKTGYPIVPISYSAKKIKVFQSWDRFILPFPFTECRVVYGDPIYVPQDADKDEASGYLACLEKELCRITLDGDRYFGHAIDLLSDSYCQETNIL